MNWGGGSISVDLLPQDLTPKNLPRNLLHFFLTTRPPLLTTPTTTGDIAVFKDMQIKELNLTHCKNLTGTFGGQGARISVVASGPHPKEPSEEPSPTPFLLTIHPFSPPPLTPGDIAVFKGMALTSLDLYKCFNLTGES